MDKIRITKDENGAVILRFEKREDCEKYTVYFRRENGRFKFLITTEKTAVRVNAVEGLCYFRTDKRRKNGEYRYCGYFFAYEAYRLYYYGLL